MDDELLILEVEKHHVGLCTLRPMDFRFEMRKTKSGNELFPDYHIEIGKQKSENDPFSEFCFDNRKRKTVKRPVI